MQPPRFARIHILPPPSLLFGPGTWNNADKYYGSTQRYYGPMAEAAAAQAGAAPGAPGTPATAHPAPQGPVSPFADSPVSFLVHGAFARGEQVIVRVCLNADRSIASSSIVESSGDPRFDELAVNWAQRVRLRQQQPADGRPVAPCGAVRVELHDAPEPAVIAGHDDELG